MPFNHDSGKMYGVIRAKEAAYLKNNYKNKAEILHQAIRIKNLQDLVIEASERNDEQEQPVIDQFAANNEIQVLQEQDNNLFTQKKINLVSMQIRSTAATEYYLKNTTDRKRSCNIRTIMAWKAKMYDGIFEKDKLNVENFINTVLNISKYRQMLNVSAKTFVDGVLTVDAMSHVIRIASNALHAVVKKKNISKKALEQSSYGFTILFCYYKIKNEQNDSETTNHIISRSVSSQTVERFHGLSTRLMSYLQKAIFQIIDL
ncbi:Hypothetical_protein [Hexamita inflata]|uniref:Hypothetical_protein n=1 Tax=Hexamita inflata TaxID=28002 RepID=A0AA86Q8A2_9EUKA|nr:Hypothetical protein HINF_LOCUS6959 [Hexamita inflata]CAI9954120.1 Hypothetical protein HINF_LOCUS41765 [Hexamita inflata]